MRVDVWSDVVCPWCYIGKRRLEAALERFPHRDSVEVVYHSFELDPTAPKRSDTPLLELLAKKYGMTPAQAAQAQAHVTQVAAQDGLAFHLEDAAPENTFDAHRLLHWARAQSSGASSGGGARPPATPPRASIDADAAREDAPQHALKEALLAAYFTAGKRLADTDVLLGAVGDAGLDPEAARAVLADPAAYADAVRADQAQARAYGIRGVPFFVIDARYGVSGAQPADSLLAALSRAWSERPPEAADGPACDADGVCES